MSRLALELRKLARCVDAVSARLNPGMLAVVALLSTAVLAVAMQRIPPLYIQDVVEGMQLSEEPTAFVTPDQPPASK